STSSANSSTTPDSPSSTRQPSPPPAAANNQLTEWVYAAAGSRDRDGRGARWQRCGWPGSDRDLGVVVAFALDLDVLVGVLVAVALLGADLGLVGLDVGLLRVLVVVAVGLAVADVDGRAVVHVVVGGVVGVAFQADRGVGDVGVTEVGHVALTEVLHRVLRVDVIALDAGELAGVGRAVDVAGGLQVTVAGGDRAVDLAGVLHRLVTGVGLRHPEVVAVDDLPAVVGEVLPGGLGAVADRVDVGGLDVAVEVTVDVHVGAVVDVGGVVL